MASKDVDQDLSKYERAVVYYTLPRVTSGVTLGLLIAYVVCLVEASAALAYGIAARDPVWTKWGTIAFAGIVSFGIVAFLGRAFVNQVRARRLLLQAHRVRDPDSKVTRTSSIIKAPDPFANHVLLRYSRSRNEPRYEIRDRRGNIAYTVERETANSTLAIHDADGGLVANVSVASKNQSFALDFGRPARLVVRRGDGGGEVAATVSTTYSLSSPTVEIATSTPTPVRHTVRDGCIYRGDRLVGRVYNLRGCVYLDVERDEVNCGLLGYYTTMS